MPLYLVPPEPPPGVGVQGYISDMLAELAKLASANGHETLATSLRVVALQAAMEESRGSATD